MAEETQQESGQTNSSPKGKGKTLIIVVLTILLIASGVGGFLLWRQRGQAKDKAKESAKHTESKSEGGDESEVKEVVELQPFIVNLADSDEPRYLRMTISLGIGESEEKPDPLFTTKVRNAILAIVTQKTSTQILTVEGKTELRKEMLSAARAAVGAHSVQAIYITDFIVQM